MSIIYEPRWGAKNCTSFALHSCDILWSICLSVMVATLVQCSLDLHIKYHQCSFYSCWPYSIDTISTSFSGRSLNWNFVLKLLCLLRSELYRPTDFSVPKTVQNPARLLLETGQKVCSTRSLYKGPWGLRVQTLRHYSVLCAGRYPDLHSLVVHVLLQWSNVEVLLLSVRSDDSDSFQQSEIRPGFGQNPFSLHI